jgi:hypothetical protein
MGIDGLPKDNRSPRIPLMFSSFALIRVIRGRYISALFEPYQRIKYFSHISIARKLRGWI